MSLRNSSGSRVRDLTHGRPMGQIFRFSLPLFFGSIFQQLYSTVDTMTVGRYVGTAQLAAVGATGSISFFILGFVSGLTSGYSVMAAQACGARDEPLLRRVIGNGVLLSLAIILLFTPLSLLLARPLLVWLGTPGDILDDAVLYISIVFGGYGFTMLYNLMASLLRAIGDSRTPLYFLILSSVLNVVLDLLLILALGWGVAGVAIATIFSQLVSGVLCVVYAVRKYPVFRLHRADLRPDGRILRQMLALGLPMALQFSLTAVGMLLMQASINGFGSVIVAGYTAASRVESLVSMLAMALGTAMATYAGQNMGARQYERLFAGVRAAVVLLTLYAAGSAALCIFAGRPVMQLFVDASDPDAEALLDTGMVYLRVFACALWPYNALMVFRNSLQGMGKTIYTLAGGCMECLMRAVVSLTLPGVLGFLGCCLAGPAAWVGALIPLLFAYAHEKRKLLRAQPS